MENKARYVLEQFNRIYGCNDVDVGYGLDQNARVRVRRAETDFFDRRVRFDTGGVIWREWKGQRIPFLFDDAERNVIEWSNNGAVIQYDILASAFYFLSGWQEIAETERDEYGRFPYAKSIQRQLGIVTVPVVNYYFDILRTAVEQAHGREVDVKPWPEAPFVTFLSHDIDKVDSAWKEESVYALRTGRLLAPLRLLALKLLGTDAWFNVDDVMNTNREYGTTGTFFFLCRKGGGGRPNADFDINEARFVDLISRLEAAGAEVGVHGSWGTHLSADDLLEDQNRLGRQVYGNRFHFLNFDAARTPALLEKAGLRYDATLGFPEHAGFRNGTCFPFFLYDLERDQATNVLEIPLVVMDTTLAEYQGLDPAEVPEIVVSLITEVKKFRGCLSLLWHNNYFSPHKYRGWGEVYRAILDIAAGADTLFLTGRDIVERYGAVKPAVKRQRPDS